jgi:hypothetical protein
MFVSAMYLLTGNSRKCAAGWWLPLKSTCWRSYTGDSTGLVLEDSGSNDYAV